MGDVVDLHCITRLEIPPHKVLDKVPRDLESVVIIGFDADGDLYFASSLPDSPNVIYLLEKAKQELFKCEDEIENGDRPLPGA